jgi:hypothetical protein
MQTFVVTYTSISLGITLLVTAIACMLKVRSGSRSGFAYTILLFTIGYSLNLITYFFIFAYLTNSYRLFRYSLTFHWYFYKLLSVQSWVFAVQYLQSAVNVSKVRKLS